MEIEYTSHAQDSIEERKIEKVWVEEAVKAPNRITTDGEKYYARKKLNGLSIEVVYAKERYIRIITVYWV